MLSQHRSHERFAPPTIAQGSELTAGLARKIAGSSCACICTFNRHCRAALVGAVKIHTPTVRHETVPLTAQVAHPDPLHSDGLGPDASLSPPWALGAATPAAAAAAAAPGPLATLLFAL